jgi:hypothetical protein
MSSCREYVLLEYESTVFQVVMPHSLHLQGQRINQARNQQMQAITSTQLAPGSAGFLLGQYVLKNISITTQMTILFTVTHGENLKSNSTR